MLALIGLMLPGCSKDQPLTPDFEDNVALTLNFPDDPMVESLVSLSAIVVGDELGNPFQTSAPIEASSGGQVELMLGLPSGQQHRITVHLVDINGRIDFWSGTVIDIAAAGTTDVALTLAQTGFGAASRVKIFRDFWPWGSHAMDEVLAANGITLGDGDSQYEVLSAADMSTTDLVPGEDLVVIANDQRQSFYDNYAAAQHQFDDFARTGGVILWEACDLAWAGGSIEEAGIVLPAAVGINPGYAYENHIYSSAWQLLSGVDSLLQGNYASHEGFTGLPGGAAVFTLDERDLPTLAVYAYGAGWVMVTGQPLEYAYDQSGAEGIGSLLPRIVCYLLGREPQFTTASGTPGNADQANGSGAQVRTSALRSAR